MDFRSGCGVGAKAPTPVTVRLAPQCADLPAAGRTTSFRRLSLRRRLVCRAGQSSRAKNGRQSCPTRRERARSSKEPTTRQKAATSPAQPRLQGQKISRTNHPGGRVKFPGASRLGPGGGRLIGPTVRQGGRPLTHAGHIPPDASYLPRPRRALSRVDDWPIHVLVLLREARPAVRGPALVA